MFRDFTDESDRLTRRADLENFKSAWTSFHELISRTVPKRSAEKKAMHDQAFETYS